MAQAKEQELALFLAHGCLKLENEEGRGKGKASTFPHPRSTPVTVWATSLMGGTLIAVPHT